MDIVYVCNTNVLYKVKCPKIRLVPNIIDLLLSLEDRRLRNVAWTLRDIGVIA